MGRGHKISTDESEAWLKLDRSDYDSKLIYCQRRSKCKYVTRKLGLLQSCSSSRAQKMIQPHAPVCPVSAKFDFILCEEGNKSMHKTNRFMNAAHNWVDKIIIVGKDVRFTLLSHSEGSVFHYAIGDNQDYEELWGYLVLHKMASLIRISLVVMRVWSFRGNKSLESDWRIMKLSRRCVDFSIDFTVTKMPKFDYLSPVAWNNRVVERQWLKCGSALNHAQSITLCLS